MAVTLPKPIKRAPRPPKRIARTSRPAKVRKTPRGKLGRLADKLFSLIVREQGACRYHSPATALCGGPLQPAHIFSRRYRSIRWDEDNAIPLCAGAHTRFTFDPIGWEDFIVTEFGRPLWDDLRKRALEPWDKDIEGTVARLKARAEALGIKA